jgi:predicted MFS family arabinose efflux permease
MALNGATTPLYRLAADAMIADLVPLENRIDAYSVIRLGNNFGVAVGPAIGGFIAAVSYNISFAITGLGLLVCGSIVAFFLIETIPPHTQGSVTRQQPLKGYLLALKDKKLLRFLGSFTFNRMCSATLWMLLAVYAKQQFGISERIYGLIPTTNAVMVILFQLLITRSIKKRAAEPAMFLGSAFYALAVFGVAFGHGFWGFWICMVIATIGEMILLPTSTTYVSSLAPEDMRARYMSLFTITWGVGTGLGPLIGGILSDKISPAATWIGGGLLGLVGALLFLFNIIVHKKDTIINQALQIQSD